VAGVTQLVDGYLAPQTPTSAITAAAQKAALIPIYTQYAAGFTKESAAGIALRLAIAAVHPIVLRAPPPTDEASAPPLTETQRLFHHTTPPTEELTVVGAHATAAGRDPRGDVLIEASSAAELDTKLQAFQDSSARTLYGLVLDKDGDRVALLKAAAINLGLQLPKLLQDRTADRTRGATGWLYAIVRLPTGGHYKRLRDYIRPELYAVA
jgi:hypothetical protein